MILLILLAIAGVVIIWGFAKTFVLSSSEDISTSSVIFGAVFDGYVSKYNEYETNQLEWEMDINLVKIAGDLDSNKLKIVFEDKEGDKFEIIENVGFKLYEGKKVSILFIDLSRDTKDVLSLSSSFNFNQTIKIYIYPIYVLESGKQKIGETPTILIRQENVFKSKTSSFSRGGSSTPPVDNNWCGNADINRDGKVDALDSNKMSVYYGECSLVLNNWCSLADINRDGGVDTLDLQVIGKYLNEDIECNAGNDNCENSNLNPDSDSIVSIGDLTIFSDYFGDGAENRVCDDDDNDEDNSRCCQNNDINGNTFFDSDDLTALKDSLGRTGCSGSSAVCSYS